MKKNNYKIAYFSAEIGISSSLPTYSGGLGVLAGDHIKAAADIGLKICAVTLLYKEGYFKQKIDELGIQSEDYPHFDPNPILKKINNQYAIKLRGRDVWIQPYEYLYRGINGHIIPIYFLDTDIEKNFEDDRTISLRLYSGDKNHRILQEAVLGFGGIRLLENLNIDNIQKYHMNEGHCSFLTLELYKKNNFNLEETKRLCHFTTHTPVPAGHDNFNKDRVEDLLKDLIPDNINLPSLNKYKRYHMTEMGLHYSCTANGVSCLHGEVAQKQFPNYNIGYITNGVYHPYWVGKDFRKIYNQFLYGWKENPDKLLAINKIPDEILWKAHQSHKHFLLGYANAQTQKALSMDVLTIGFARRSAEYKRATLLFSDINKLQKIAEGGLQIIFSGKAHPNDKIGKKIIKDIYKYSNQLFKKIKIIYLENYNMWLGKLITSGVDVWLNTPLRPNEASGTSGMKASLNGIPNLSIRDGWWSEACLHGSNGWGIGEDKNTTDIDDADNLYRLLEDEVIPAYKNRKKWLNFMRESIKTGSRYTAFHMVNKYKKRYY